MEEWKGKRKGGMERIEKGKEIDGQEWKGERKERKKIGRNGMERNRKG